jgi:hypothetical protein
VQRFVGTYAHVQLAIRGGLLKKRHVSAVKHVVASAYKNFFHYYGYLGLYLKSANVQNKNNFVPHKISYHFSLFLHFGNQGSGE